MVNGAVGHKIQSVTGERNSADKIKIIERVGTTLVVCTVKR